MFGPKFFSLAALIILIVTCLLLINEHVKLNIEMGAIANQQKMHNIPSNLETYPHELSQPLEVD